MNEKLLQFKPEIDEQVRGRENSFYINPNIAVGTKKERVRLRTMKLFCPSLPLMGREV
jgi:hypothetical protein